jgi:dTMP kinase
MELPRPDLVIYLDVPTELTERLMRHREADTHTHADIHEKDLDYLRLCRRTGLEAAAYYGWTVVHCERNGEMRPIEDIHEEIYRLVQSCLNEQERSNVG